MGRPKNITKSEWLKIADTMQRVNVRIRVDDHTYKIPTWKASLPLWLRGLSLPSLKGRAAIFFSRRLRSKTKIIETVKHEVIHLILNDGKHGREFKRLCLVYGLNPKNHA